MTAVRTLCKPLLAKPHARGGKKDVESKLNVLLPELPVLGMQRVVRAVKLNDVVFLIW
jgi:hypothetical protein